MAPQRFPVSIRRGSIRVGIYRVKHRTAAAGHVFTVAWHAGTDRFTKQFTDYSEAHAHASFKADQLAGGKVDSAARFNGDDVQMIDEARKICGEIPILSALQEWAKVRDLTDGNAIAAAEAWRARNTTRFKRITVAEAVDDFISSKDRAGRQGERTYRSKLEPLKKAFPDQYLDTITARSLDAYLEQWADGVTRNDFRKRAVALWRWAYKKNHLPRGVQLEIESTERAEENASEIGIINADTYGKLLEYFRAQHPEYLAALVLAGFCGIRADEIHGKRADRTQRQTWEDIYLDKQFVRVTVAKRNTPAWRYTPLCDAAVEWLMLSTNRKGPICEAGAMEKVRLIARGAGFKLPENCLRHSFISYRIPVAHGNKQQVATESGNSVKEIDRRYRVPVTKAEGEAWFSIRPSIEEGKILSIGSNNSL